MRQVVTEVQCARCERKETRKYDATEKEPPPALIATLSIGVALEPGSESNQIRFDDLCAPCYRSVKALLEQIGKRVKGMSPDRVAKEKAAPKAKEKDPTPSPAPGPRPQPAKAVARSS
jgi:hypothetical protein